MLLSPQLCKLSPLTLPYMTVPSHPSWLERACVYLKWKGRKRSEYVYALLCSRLPGLFYWYFRSEFHAHSYLLCIWVYRSFPISHISCTDARVGTHRAWKARGQMYYECIYTRGKRSISLYMMGAKIWEKSWSLLLTTLETRAYFRYSWVSWLAVCVLVCVADVDVYLHGIYV